MALGRAGAETRSGTVRERIVVAAVSCSFSITSTTKVNEPALVGVPLRTPVVPLSDMPDGSDPKAMDHAKGGIPPAT